MTYVVSARRWRPQTFEDLIGQEHVSRTLTNAIRSGKVAHAFLFTGLRGVGKTTAARILAKALNCERGPGPTPCNACTNCQEITAGTAVDVLEIDGASNTGVDDVRQIIENVRYQAAKSRFKIYIIDEVHMLSNSAFNALLKTLEEPPAHVKFIFATTDPHKLPPTVQSRCQRYDFRRIPLRLVVSRLRQIVEAEGVQISDRALFVLAREGEGSMRDAQSLLDQVLAYGGQTVEDADALAILGVADRTVIYDIGAAVIDRTPARALEVVETVHGHGHDLRRLVRDLLEHFRNLAVAKVTNGDLLPDLPEEELVAVRQQADRISAEDCDRCFRVLQEADEEAGRSPYPKLVLEMTLIKLATLPPLVPVDELLDRIGEIESRLRRPAAAAPTPPASPARATPRPAEGAAVRPGPAAEVAAPAAPPAVAPREAPVNAGWTDFVAFVARERAPLAHHLEKCTVARFEDKVIELRAPKGFCYNYLARRDHVAEVTELAKRFFQRDLAVAFTADEAGNGKSGKAAPGDTAPSKGEVTDAALGNPAVRAAVEILGGEVQEVRLRRPRAREEK